MRLIKHLITENQIFGLKIIILLLKLMKETMNIMTQMMKKKEKACLKSIIWKFENDPNDPNFDLFKCVGDINLYILNLCEKKKNTKQSRK